MLNLLLRFEHLEHETLRWVGFYNHDRLHEELKDVPPSEYEHRMTRSPKTVQPARKKDAPASVNDYKETKQPSLH